MEHNPAGAQDYPGEYEWVCELYPAIDLDALPGDRDEIADLLITVYWDRAVQAYRDVGGDVYPDLERNATDELERAADVRHAHR